MRWQRIKQSDRKPKKQLGQHLASIFAPETASGLAATQLLANVSLVTSPNRLSNYKQDTSYRGEATQYCSTTD